VSIDPGSGTPASPPPPTAAPPAPQAPPAPAPVDPAAALIDVRNQVLRLGQQIGELRAEAAGREGPDSAAQVVAELREAVRFLAERLDGVARMVAQRGEELADNRTSLATLDAHLVSQGETITVLTAGMQALPSYGAGIAALQDRLGALQESLNAVQQRVASVEGSFGPLAQRIEGVAGAVGRPDSAQAERLATIEGMLGPMAQRLAQAHADHAASLQALHARLEALASGTQAALATPVAVDDSAVAALEPRLAAIVTEIAALREEIGAREAARADAVAASGGGDDVVLALNEDLDAALRRAERRISAHIDDAVLALAQTLFGRSATAVPDALTGPIESERYDPVAAAVAAGAAADDEDAADGSYPQDETGYAEDDSGEDDEGEYDAADGGEFTPVDFSRAEVAGEGDERWAAEVAPSNDVPFDQEAIWNSGPATPSTPPTVVPERRKRWFSR
jgi:hypothetical protein